MNTLRDIRKSKGLTLEKAAELVDASVAQIQKLEKGERRLSMPWAERLATAYGVQVAELLGLKSTVARVQVVGYLRSHSLVHRVASMNNNALETTIDGPADAKYAVQVQTSDNKPMLLQGWWLYTGEWVYGVLPEYLGELCLIKLADSDEIHVAVVERAGSGGKYNLLPYGKETPLIRNAAVEKSAPVMHMRMDKFTTGR